MFRSMLPAVAALLMMLVYPVVMPATGNAETTFSAPVCREDMPCWRAFMGNGEARLSPETVYMWLPYGPSGDALAPLFGYQVD